MEKELVHDNSIDSLADTLANSHDWLSQAPVTQIAEVMIQNNPDLDRALATFVAKKFMNLSLSERIRSSFDHRMFVLDAIRGFGSN